VQDGGIHDTLAPDGNERAARHLAPVGNNIVLAAYKLPLLARPPANKAKGATDTANVIAQER